MLFSIFLVEGLIHHKLLKSIQKAITLGQEFVKDSNLHLLNWTFGLELITVYVRICLGGHWGMVSFEKTPWMILRLICLPSSLHLVETFACWLLFTLSLPFQILIDKWLPWTSFLHSLHFLLGYKRQHHNDWKWFSRVSSCF